MKHTNTHQEVLDDIGCDYVEVDVNLLTWGEFIRQNNIKHVDLFVLDVEGHELSVIEGMVGCQVLPDIICVEIGHLDFLEIRRALEDLGYIYDITSHVNAYFIKSKLIPLFNFRSTVFQSIDLFRNSKENNINMNSDLSDDNEILKSKISHLERQLFEIVSSKSWRLIELYRKLINKFKNNYQ